MRTLVSVLALPLLLSACGQSDEAPRGAAGSGGASGSGGAGPEAGTDARVYPEPYGIEALASERIGSSSMEPNFQKAMSEINLRDPPFESVKLHVELATTCFPFEGWQTNPPPAGQRWPADCDAFDRNFEVSLDDPEAGSAGPPGLELVRAITPFGGPLALDVDITDVANGLPGKHRLFVHIATWSDSAGQSTGSNGGWNVSARLEVDPGPAPRQVLAVLPLFYGSVTEAAGEPIEFQTPAGTATTRLEYRATGHGGVLYAPGCAASAPADEFCRRTHTLIADGSPLSDIEPWRDDCDTLCTIAHQPGAGGGFDYCTENPCGAIDSVRAERAGWCPGSVTPPFILEHPALSAAGAHDLRWQISDVAAGGGSWRLSSVFFAFGP